MVSFSDKIDLSPSPLADNRNSALIFEHNAQTYIISEMPTDSDTSHDNVIQIKDSRLSLYDVAQMRTTFDKIDINSNGFIEKIELRDFLNRMSHDVLPRGMATTILKQADKNSDGVLSFDEFVSLCQTHNWLAENFVKYCGQMTGFMSNDSEVKSYEHNYMHQPIFPLVIYTFTIVLIIFYMNDLLTNMAAGNGDNDSIFSILSTTFIFDNAKKFQIWRFITYMFVHADFCHLGSNLFLILTAGIPLEVIHGCRCVLLIYLGSGLAGSIGVASISNCLYLIGSSAGAFGLVGAQFSTLALNWNEMNYKFIRILIISVFVTINTIICLYSTIQIGNGLTITTISHVSGFIMGFLIGIITLKNMKVLVFEKQLQEIAKLIILCIVALTFMLFVWLPKEYKIDPIKHKQL